jgi:hypothetical protein
VPFPYLLRAHVKLYYGLSLQSGGYTQLLADGVNYTWTSATQVQLSAAPVVGQTLSIRRETPTTSRLVDWNDGSNLTADALDTADLQNFYAIQEHKDYIEVLGINPNTNVTDGSITANKLSSDAVTTIKIQDGAVTSSKIQDGAVTSSKIQDGAVTSSKIQDGAIVNADVNAAAGIASSKLSFTQSGAGATTRTVDSKLKDIISVKDFGATGNGSTDDTAAIQAAINAARAVRGAVYFPPNNVAQSYNITAPLTCDGPITIIGAGPTAVLIYAVGLSAGQYILDFDLPVTSNYFFDIKGITLRSNNQAPNGIRLKNTSYCTLANVQLYDLANGIAITGANCFSNYFENLVCYQIAARSISFVSFTGGGHYTFNHCTFTGNYGFEIDSASGISELAFTSCNFEQCVTNSFAAIGTVQGLSFVGCRTEGLNGSADFLIYPSAGNEVTGLSVTGCYFTTDAGASVPISLGGNGGAVRGFNICGNHVEYAATGNFVTLNGDGESGLIAGNYFNLTTTTPTNVRRNGVVIYANENATGKCVESWGNATWGVEEGTFTPSWIGTTVAGNTVPATNNGRYTRNGNTVTVWIWGYYLLDSYSTKPTGQVRINNLPFVAASTPYYYEFPVTASRVTHTLPIFGQITEGTSSILLFEENAVSTNNPTAVDWTNVRDPFGGFSLQFSYRI